jgi:predicted  nucleic acid-binding Zn-ribbon protein
MPITTVSCLILKEDSMTDEQTSAPSAAESVQEMDRVRDIIFGPQMRDYAQQFQAVQRDLERLQQEIDRLAEGLADQDSSQTKKLQDLRREMRRADDGLRDELRQTAQRLTTDKVDRVALGELFIELGTHLKTGGSLADVLKGLGEKEQD